jgi:hypothetical protein
MNMRQPYIYEPNPQEWFNRNNSNLRLFDKKVKNFLVGPSVITEDKPIRIDPEIKPLLSPKLKDLEKVILASKYLKNLQEVDTETGEIIHNYEPTTWVRATTFLINFANWALSEEGTIIPSPKVYDGPNGSIDVYWKSDGYRLLVNFPENVAEFPTYYGDNYDAQTPIKSKINSKNQVLSFRNILSILDPSYVAY